MNVPVVSGPVSVVGQPLGYGGDAGLRPPARRWRVFVVVFVLVAAGSLAANYLRPAIYRSAATLLVEAPASQTRAAGIALGDSGPAGGVMLAAPTRSAQLLATEQQRLLATPLLQTLAEEFGADLASGERAADPLAALQAMAQVKFDAATSLLDVALEGRSAALLQRILERWLALYETSRQDTSARVRDTDDQSLREQLTALDVKIAAQRATIDGFRAAHGIVSEERTENMHAAKLKGLNESINTAADDEMRAAARLDALRAASVAGKPVADGQTLVAIERLQTKVETLRDLVRAQGDQFTEKYAQIAPEIVAARKDLEQAEHDLDDMRARATAETISKAETELATARDARAALLQQQRALGGELTNFTQRFDELTALRARLAELEAQAAPLRERLVQTEVAAADLAPRVSVLAAPSLPSRPVRPAYTRDAALGMGAAFGAALLVTVLLEFLTRAAPAAAIPASPPQPQIYSLNTQLFPPPGQVAALPSGIAPGTGAVASLPAPSYRPRELAPEEIAALLQAGDARAQLMIALLVSGVSATELAALRSGDLGPDARLAVGLPTRTLALAPGVLVLWQRLAADSDAPLLASAGGVPLADEDLQGTLVYVAHDAGLSRPDEVTADALRHTGFAWLVRQGLKLGELPRIGGALAPAVIASYAPLSPPGAGRTLAQLPICYPALAELG